MANWFMGGALLVNASPNFDLVISYYRQFGSEPTAATDTFVEVSLDASRGAKFGPDLVRFSNFLELIQGLSAVAARGFVVLANHGMSDRQDQPLGLQLELTRQHSPWRVDEYVLGLLAGYADNEPSESDLANAERSSQIGPTNAHLPAGTLKALHEALKVLRSKKLERLEIRACNLGGNSNVMQLLLKVFGITGAITAPDVHMFYGAVPPHTRPMNTASFNHFKIVHRTAREFTDATSQNQGKVALQVNGHGAHRTTAFASDTVDVSWFVDQNIMWGDYSPPAQGARLIPPFGFAGMDVNGSFALPLETGYRRHIIEFTP